ncbi:MAG: CDP-6-deoxy-delta-3,4-glucoseen reductase [Acidiferrobacterales bacterium]|nr:CDP-6-deoxy-delta-3,4-glucoseen reductase [Acidiferrobacterales bacterium]
MSWKIQIKKSGHEFQVEEGESVLTAALRQNIGLPYGCRNGNCGSCRATLLEGEVDYGDHLPSVLSVDEMAENDVILCQARPKTDLVIDADELQVVAGLQPRIMPCRVTRIEKLTDDVIALSLKLPQNQQLKYLAGQYIDILLTGGKRRSYSLAHAPDTMDELELHVGYVEGGLFTSHVFEKMKERELLRFNGPLGSFFIRGEIEEPIILVAGGTGYAPIQAMIEQWIAGNDSREVHFYMGARRPGDLYMHQQCLQWEKEHERFHYTPVLSALAPEDKWEGETGWIQDRILKDFGNLEGFQLYTAGPPVMVHALKKELVKAGLRPHRMFYDSFEYAAQ